MVTFEVFYESEAFFEYYYYPEGKENESSGIIRLYKMSKNMEIIKMAAKDKNGMYVFHVIKNIMENLEKEVVLKKGMAAWY